MYVWNVVNVVSIFGGSSYAVLFVLDLCDWGCGTDMMIIVNAFNKYIDLIYKIQYYKQQHSYCCIPQHSYYYISSSPPSLPSPLIQKSNRKSTKNQPKYLCLSVFPSFRVFHWTLKVESLSLVITCLPKTYCN